MLSHAASTDSTPTKFPFLPLRFVSVCIVDLAICAPPVALCRPRSTHTAKVSRVVPLEGGG
jgi:hypothetical protein